MPKAAVRRLCKLEMRFGVTAVRKSSVLSPEEAVIQMLAAGDWGMCVCSCWSRKRRIYGAS